MAFRIVEMTARFHMKIQDGALIDSPYILDSILYPALWPYDAPVLLTKSNSINIVVEDRGFVH